MSRPRSPSRPGRPPHLPAPRPWERTVPDVMTALRAGVPISLLIDLAALDGPDSVGILATEGSEADAEWISLMTPMTSYMAE